MSSERGASLLQLLIVVAILGALEVGFIDFLMSTYNSRQRAQAKSDRYEKLTQLSTMLTLPNSLLESANLIPQNEQLKACVRGGPAGVCTTNCCKNGEVTGFYYVDPLDPALTVSEKRHVSGPIHSPVYYSETGKTCEPANTQCSYMLSSTFEAHCPGGAATCDHAEHLKINLLLKPASSFGGIKPQDLTLYHFVHLNYQPFITPVPAQSVKIGTPLFVQVKGDSGHPSELQNFKWEKCVVTNAALLGIVCYPFSSGQAEVQLTGIAPGKTTVTLQLSDGSVANTLSPEATFEVEVIP